MIVDIVAICTKPTQWFERVRDQGPEARSLSPAIVAIVGSWASAMGTALTEQLCFGKTIAWASVLFAPLLSLIGLALGGCLTYVLLLIVRAKPPGVLRVIEVLAWSKAALWVGVVPLIGPLLGELYSLVLVVIGLSVLCRVSTARALLAWSLTPLPVVTLALLVRVFAFEAYKVPAGSMQPTLLLGDHFFVNKVKLVFAGVRAGDVVVFRSPEHPEQDFVKRVIGVGGDKIEIEQGRPIINGRKVLACKAGIMPREAGEPLQIEVEKIGERRYLVAHDPTAQAQTHEGPFVVEPGHFLVLGDNRENSYDSRQWFNGKGATVPRASVKGIAATIWVSFLPTGSIRGGRAGVALNLDPACPLSAGSELCVGIEKCLSGQSPFE